MQTAGLILLSCARAERLTEFIVTALEIGLPAGEVANGGDPPQFGHTSFAVTPTKQETTSLMNELQNNMLSCLN